MADREISKEYRGNGREGNDDSSEYGGDSKSDESVKRAEYGVTGESKGFVRVKRVKA